MPLPDLLERLLTTPGPSGQERAAAAVWREAAAPVGEVSSDALGSSWVRVPGTAGGPSLALVGHIDEIGVVVTHLGDDGLAALRPIGGFDPHVMLGQRVDVLTRGGTLPGVVASRFQKRKRLEERKPLDHEDEGKVVLGGGPTLSRGPSMHPDVFELLHDTAEADGIPFGIEVSRGTTSTDADAVYLSRRGVATGLVSIPLRYMHSPIETVDLGDIEDAVRLIVAFALKLEPGLSFAG